MKVTLSITLWALVASGGVYAACEAGVETQLLAGGCPLVFPENRYAPWRPGQRGNGRTYTGCQGVLSVKGAASADTGLVEVECSNPQERFWVNPRYLQCGDQNTDETHAAVIPSAHEEGQIAVCGGDPTRQATMPPQSHATVTSLGGAASIILRNAQQNIQGCLNETESEHEAIRSQFPRLNVAAALERLNRVNGENGEGSWLSGFTNEYNSRCEIPDEPSRDGPDRREEYQSFCRIAKDSVQLLEVLRVRLQKLRARDPNIEIDIPSLLDEIGRLPHDQWSNRDWPWVNAGEALDPNNISYISTLKKNVLYALMNHEERRRLPRFLLQTQRGGTVRVSEQMFYACYYFTRGANPGETQSDCSTLVNLSLGNSRPGSSFSVSDWSSIALGEIDRVRGVQSSQDPEAAAEARAYVERVRSCFERVLPRRREEIYPGDILISKHAGHMVIVADNGSNIDSGPGNVTTIEAAGGNLNSLLSNVVRPVEEPSACGSNAIRPIRSDLYVLRFKANPPASCPLLREAQSPASSTVQTSE